MLEAGASIESEVHFAVVANSGGAVDTLNAQLAAMAGSSPGPGFFCKLGRLVVVSRHSSRDPFAGKLRCGGPKISGSTPSRNHRPDTKESHGARFDTIQQCLQSGLMVSICSLIGGLEFTPR